MIIFILILIIIIIILATSFDNKRNKIIANAINQRAGQASRQRNPYHIPATNGLKASERDHNTTPYHPTADHARTTSSQSMPDI